MRSNLTAATKAHRKKREKLTIGARRAMNGTLVNLITGACSDEFDFRKYIRS